MREGLDEAQRRKEFRYGPLVQAINELKTWKCHLRTVEIGARGLVASRAYRAFVSLGILPREARKLCKSLSIAAARCSYAIYLSVYDWKK